MKSLKCVAALVLISFISYQTVCGQEQVIYVEMAKEKPNKNEEMRTYLIEREIPDAGKLNPEELKGISQQSCAVLKEMGPGIEWLHSYVTDNKVYCLYKAENEELIREHANKGGFPVNYVTELATTINPETAK